MRDKAPIEAPLFSGVITGADGKPFNIHVSINNPAWLAWFQSGLDLYRETNKYVDPKYVNYGKYEPESPYVGLLAYANGDDWDPGDGEGVYVYEDGEWRYVVREQDDFPRSDIARIQTLERRIIDLENSLSKRILQYSALEQRISDLERSI